MAPEIQQTSNSKDDDNLLPWIHAVSHVLSTGPFEEPESMPVQVLPWLYISDIGGLYNKMQLMELGITHVLTTNTMYSLEEVEKFQTSLARCGIQHCYVSGEDYPGYDMINNHWDKCRTFLEQVGSDEKNKVVVHCAAGQNRSGLIVAAALLVLEQMPLLQAVQLLKEKRGIVLTNRSFQQQLCLLAQRQGLLGDALVGYSSKERVEADTDD